MDDGNEADAGAMNSARLLIRDLLAEVDRLAGAQTALETMARNCRPCGGTGRQPVYFNGERLTHPCQHCADVREALSLPSPPDGAR